MELAASPCSTRNVTPSATLTANSPCSQLSFVFCLSKPGTLHFPCNLTCWYFWHMQACGRTPKIILCTKQWFNQMDRVYAVPRSTKLTFVCLLAQDTSRQPSTQHAGQGRPVLGFPTASSWRPAEHNPTISPVRDSLLVLKRAATSYKSWQTWS